MSLTIEEKEVKFNLHGVAIALMEAYDLTCCRVDSIDEMV